MTTLVIDGQPRTLYPLIVAAFGGVQGLVAQAADEDDSVVVVQESWKQN